MKTNGNDPGNPIPMDKALSFTDNPEYGLGLTKRERFAMAAMTGYMAHEFTGHQDPHGVAEYAVNCADALIKALNKEVANG